MTYIFVKNLFSDCQYIKADQSYIDITLNNGLAKLRLKGRNLNKNRYTKEGSSCILKSDSGGELSSQVGIIRSKIQSITNNFVQIKLKKVEKWKRIYQTFNVICDLNLRRSNTTEKRQTRPVSGGGPNDENIYGGGVTIVNSTDIEIDKVTVTWTKPPMTHNVSIMYFDYS